MRFNKWILLTVLMTTAAASLQAVVPVYKVVQKIPVTGDGGWDLLTVDADARRLYISHDTQMQVLNIDTFQEAGEIKKLDKVHGIAIAPDLNRGYISNGRNNSVTLFELKDVHVLDQVKKVGNNPDVILYDQASRQVFVFNGKSDDVAVLEGGSGKIQKILDLGGKPEFALADGEGTVYVNLEDTSKLLKIDARKLTILARWDLAPCKEPSALAMDRGANKLFVGCQNKMMAVVDAVSGRVVMTLPIGDHVDGAVFDSASGLIFFSNGEGTITMIQEDSLDTFHVAGTIPTQRGARTIALDPKTHRLFLPVADLGPEPKPSSDNPHPRPQPLPGTFAILVVAPSGKP